MENTAQRLDYMDQGWLVSMRKMFGEIDIMIWIEDAWQPELQRENDAAIMELFADLPGAFWRDLEKCNQVRLYLRVITMADTTHESGEYIPDNMLTGKWQSGSYLECPRKSCPLLEYWAVFRRFLRSTVCRCTEATQPAHYAMTLDTPLKTWQEVKRYAWFSCYCTESAIYHRDEDQGVFQIFQGKGAGFY